MMALASVFERPTCGVESHECRDKVTRSIDATERRQKKCLSFPVFCSCSTPTHALGFVRGGRSRGFHCRGFRCRGVHCGGVHGDGNFGHRHSLVHLGDIDFLSCVHLRSKSKLHRVLFFSSATRALEETAIVSVFIRLPMAHRAGPTNDTQRRKSFHSYFNSN